jgi:phage tail-like protein
MASNDVYQELSKSSHAAFRFVVDVDGKRQGVFTECTLPSIEWDVEEVKEGGLNVYTHQLPGRRKGVKLTLKNGVGTDDLVEWYVNTMSEKFARKTVTLALLDAKYNAVMTWEIQGAYPVKWTGPQLKSSDNSIAIQTLELACGEITVTR